MPPARKPRWERRPRRSPVLMPSVVSRGGDGSPSRVLINAGDGTFPMSITLPGGSAITGWIAAVDLDGAATLTCLRMVAVLCSAEAAGVDARGGGVCT